MSDPLGRIHDLAKYLREPAWAGEGIRLVGAQIQEHVAEAVAQTALLHRALEIAVSDLNDLGGRIDTATVDGYLAAAEKP